MTTCEIDASVARLNEQRATLQRNLDTERQRAAALERDRDSIRTSALRNDDASAKKKLTELRQQMAVAQMATTDIGEELVKVDAELEQLLDARSQAVEVEAWSEFLALSEEVIQESVNFDGIIEELFQTMQPYCSLLQRLNTLMVRAGCHEKPFSLETFRRTFDEKLRVGFQKYFGRQGRLYRKGSVYENAYSSIIETRLKGIIERHSGAERPKAAVNE